MYKSIFNCERGKPGAIHWWEDAINTILTSKSVNTGYINLFLGQYYILIRQAWTLSQKAARIFLRFPPSTFHPSSILHLLHLHVPTRSTLQSLRDVNGEVQYFLCFSKITQLCLLFHVRYVLLDDAPPLPNNKRLTFLLGAGTTHTGVGATHARMKSREPRRYPALVPEIVQRVV